MGLKELGANPVAFAVSDGTKIVVSGYAADFLKRQCATKKVKAVKVAGGRYLYMPRKMPRDLSPIAVYTGEVGRYITWPLADFLARHVYHLHRYVPGEGRIRHDGSDSFLPENFKRDEWTVHTSRRESQKKPKTQKPLVDSDVVQQQMLWFDGDLQKTAYKVAAKKLNAQVGPDVVHDVWCELLAVVLRGRCDRTTEKTFKGWVIGAVKYKCCEIAKQGCVNGDVLPDKFETQMKKDDIFRGAMPDETRSRWQEMEHPERSHCGRNFI